MAIPQKKVSSRQTKIPPLVIDNRKPNIPDPPTIDPEIANKAVRTVLYVEVRDMDQAHVQLLVQEINKTFDGAKGGIHYVVPIRHGKIGSDFVFESEFLATVNQVCEIKDNQIVLKDGAKDVYIIRHRID